jgi:hypothetical protein
MFARRGYAALAAAALVIGAALNAAPARAAVVDVLIDFNELANNGNDNGTAPNTNAYKDTYGSPDPHNFFFKPVNFSNSANCYSGNCLLEFGGNNAQTGFITTMIKPESPWTTNPNDLVKSAFTLNSFFFDLQGTTSNASNFLEVEGFDATGIAIAGAKVTFKIGDKPNANPSAPQVALAHDSNNQNTQLYPGTLLGVNDAIAAGPGYFVFLGDLFKDVYSVNFTAKGPGNTRIDDIRVSYVPLPAAAWLMLAGLGGLGLMSRRKANAA